MKHKDTNLLFEFSNRFQSEPRPYGSLKLYQFGETCLHAGAKILEHLQSCHEISLVVSGSGVMSADGIFVKCVPGDVHIVSKEVHHSIEASPGEKLRYIHFAFDFDGDENELATFFSTLKGILVQDNGNLKNLLYMLIHEFYNDGLTFSEPIKHHLIHLVPHYVWRLCNENGKGYLPEDGKGDKASVVYKIIRYIEENMPMSLKVNEIAKEFSYNENYLSHLFKDKTGMSLQEYLLMMRMKYAEEFLLDEKLSLSEIAERCGYKSLQSFCRAFKKHQGSTPMRFAKNEKQIRNSDAWKMLQEDDHEKF